MAAVRQDFYGFCGFLHNIFFAPDQGKLSAETISKITKRTHFQKIETVANTGFSLHPAFPVGKKRTHFPNAIRSVFLLPAPQHFSYRIPSTLDARPSQDLA